MAKNKDVIVEAFNFSNEIQITVSELTEKILKLTGFENLKPTVLNEAHHEISHKYLNAGKARRILDWKPAFTLD